MLNEPAALEIQPRQPIGALRIPAGDANEVVGHAERLRVRRDAMGDDDGDRSENELTQHHVVDDPVAVGEVAPDQHVGELLRPERLESPVVDRDSGQRAGDRAEQLSLHVGETVLACDRRRDPARDELHLADIVAIRTNTEIRIHATGLCLAPAGRLRALGAVPSAGGIVGP